MEESFSETVLKRLPSIIQKLDLLHQKVYIYLRLRKGEEEISRLLGIPLEEVREKERIVKEALISAGQIDLIKDPQFVSIHSHCPDTQELQLSAKELSNDKKLIINEFLSFLKETIKELPQHQSRLLRLRYNHQMSAKEIVDFSKKMKINFIPEKNQMELKEQDIFYALNVVLKAVLKGLKERYGEESPLCMDNLKDIFEEIEI